MSLYRPPAPIPRTPVSGLIRAMLSGERDLLSLLPDIAYTTRAGPLGKSRRGIVIVNDPALVTQVLVDADQVFPKNDLLVGALEAVVGNSMFVSSGETWRRQRRMIEPAFSHMRVDRAFDAMQSGINSHEAVLDAHASTQKAFSLDAAMSQLTADIICRTIFTQSLASQTAREVFAAFGQFERSVANTEIPQLLFGKPFATVPQKQKVIQACTLIRRHIGDLLDPRLAPGAPIVEDIVGAVIAARDTDTGQTFTREALIDQIGVFFLAGHETTASVLTWIFFILSQNQPIAERIRHEVRSVCGEGEIRLEHTKQLGYVRAVFREAMRLYPPITFIPRVAMRDTELGGLKLKRGCMVMIAPWTIHRSPGNWPNPDRFDPQRFASQSDIPSGAYIPFGLGPRICVGAAFATIESTLILARLVRRYDFVPLDPKSVRPVARLTTKPFAEIMCRVRPRSAQAQAA